MPTLLSILLVLSCADSRDGATAKAPSAMLTHQQLIDVEKDKIIVLDRKSKSKSCANQSHLVALIKSSKAEVWRHLMDTEKWTEFFPNLVSVIEYTRGDEVGHEEITSVWGVKTKYHVLVTKDEERGYMAWRLDASRENDIKDTHGLWVLEDYRGKCLIRYCVCLDAGGKVKNIVVGRGGLRKAKQLVSALRTRSERPREKP